MPKAIKGAPKIITVDEDIEAASHSNNLKQSQLVAAKGSILTQSRVVRSSL